MEATKHAMLSPSGAHRWTACAGAPAMEHGLPDNGNEYSAEGTCAHAVAAMCLAESKPAAAYIGRRVHVSPHETYEFREDMAAPLQKYVDFVNSLPGEKHYEQTVPIGHITSEKDATGTADVVALVYEQREIIVDDLKFGQGVPVTAERNKQGIMYALGALAKFDPLGDLFDRIRIIIHQPRINDAPSEWDCSVADLLAFAAEHLIPHAKTALVAFEHRVNWMSKSFEYLEPGEEQCKFCKAKATCPALTKLVSDAVGADFETIANIGALPYKPDDKEAFTEVTLSVTMKVIPLIEDWIKAVRAEIERRLLAGEKVPGFKLVMGRQGNRAWNDEKAVEDLLRKQFRLPMKEAYDMKLISPTTAEERLGKREKQWSALQPHITRAPGKPSVAPESDKRPEYTNNAADDFDVGADLV